MKRLVASMICLCLLFIGVVALADDFSSISGEWTESFDIALEFEYKKNDVPALTDHIWNFNEDGTISQYFADEVKVNDIILSLMTKIITAEITADGGKINDVAKEEGFSSVQAFVQSIIKNEKLDAFSSNVEEGTYTVNGNELTFVWPTDTNEAITAVYYFSIDDDKLTLTNKENADDTITLIKRK